MKREGSVFAIDDEAFGVIDTGTVSVDTPDAVDIDATDTDQ